MSGILATRGAATTRRATRCTETRIEGVHSLIYKPGVEPVPFSGEDQTQGKLGTFARGVYRISGFVFSYHGSAAETLFAVTAGIDLIIRYRASGQKRKRTLSDVIFIGDATVTVPALNTGVSDLIGVPFRVQIPSGETFAEHVTDVGEP